MFSIRSLHTNELIGTELLDLCGSSVSPLLFEKNLTWFISDKSAIAFFQYKNTLISVGGILASQNDKEQTLKDFLKYCKDKKYQYLFLHFPKEDIPVFENNSLLINQLGASYTIDIKNYSLEGKKFQQLRNKINKAKKSGVSVERIDEQANFEILKPRLKEINKSWLKGKKAKHLTNLVTDFETLNLDSGLHKLYTANKENEVIAYIIYSKNFGKFKGWFHNITRKAPDTQDGVMQLINQKALNELEDLDYLNFGFTPLVELQPNLNFNSSPTFHKIMKFMESKGGVVYPARSQRQYKMSWRPQIIDYEYIAFPQGKAIKSLLTLLRSTNSI